MNVVLIGDIGWRYLYHLGDEAMTEAAIDMLQIRGVDNITLVAGEPEVAERFYGLPSVRRVRFRADWTRERNEHRLADVARVLKESDWDDHPIYPAIRDADAVVIAGGGNMNSRDYHLLFERVAAKRIAEHFGTPLYVTSQTVGPMLEPRDRDLVVEIAEYARCFGAREAVTAALLREHVASPERIHHTLDDALMLEADDHAVHAVDELTRNNAYIVASFTHHPGTLWPSLDEYCDDIATLCRDLSLTHDVDVLLVPHAGSLDAEQFVRDQETNVAIEERANSERVFATRMVTAREDVALIARSALSLSTRYHPTVFASASGTPSVAIAPSYYSSVRMRGSLSNVGLQSFVVPTPSMHLIREAIAEAIAPDESLRAFLLAAKERALQFQNAWWDALVASISADSSVDFDEALEPGRYVPQGEWSSSNEELLPLSDLYAQGVDARERLATLVEDGRLREQALSAKLAATEAQLERYKARKAVRVLDLVGQRIRGN